MDFYGSFHWISFHMDGQDHFPSAASSGYMRVLVAGILESMLGIF